MIITCPRCRTKLRLAAEKVPSDGAWARCPKCSDRFFIPAAGQNLSDIIEPAQPLVTSTDDLKSRDEDRQRLLNQLKANKTAPPDEAVGLKSGHFDMFHDVVTIYPEVVAPPFLRQVIIGILLVLPLIAIGWAFRYFTVPQTTVAASSPLTVVKKMNDQDNVDLIKNDLINLKGNMIRRPYVSAFINYSGPETRIFNYFMKRLAPNGCPRGISSLNIDSAQPTLGFVATATCLGPDDSQKLLMHISWTPRTAQVAFKLSNGQDYGQYSEFEMFGLTGRPPLP